MIDRFHLFLALYDVYIIASARSIFITNHSVYAQVYLNAKSIRQEMFQY